MMKYTHQHAIVSTVTVLLLAACGSDSDPVRTTTLWVAPEGSDTADGSMESPLKTLDGARQRIRLEHISVNGNVVVNLKSGTYRLDQTLAFDANDSGADGHTVTYRAADGEKVSIVGSEQIPPSKWSICDTKNGHAVYCANLSNLDPRVLESRQLYVNGDRAVRAKTKDYPGGFMPYFGYNEQDLNQSDPVGIMFIPLLDEADQIDPDWPDPLTWTNVRDIEAVALPQWRMLRVPLESVIPFPGYAFLDPEIDPIYAEGFEFAYDIDYQLGTAWATLFSDINHTGLITLQEPGWTNANLSYTSDGNATDATYKAAIWGFTRVAYFENAYAFLDEPGEWYLDKHTARLYYIPNENVNMATAEVELPKLEYLVDVNGASNLRFEAMTFAYATWTQPSSGIGYVADQSGYLITDEAFEYNQIGHVRHVEGTPGNIRLEYVNNIVFSGNIFEHLGAVALSFGTGTQNCIIEDNLFEDIASAAINLGGVGKEDYAPDDNQLTKNNTIRNNLIRYTAQEYYDAAAVFVGFTTETKIDHNTIAYTNWSGIAMGWGWGLLDPGINLGLSNATPNMWGVHDEPTPNSYNEITNNRTYKTLGQLWDAGGVYTTGFQGTSSADALLIEGNVFSDKNPHRGGNTVYSDGMSRFITVRNNVMYNNPQAKVFLGEPVADHDPFALQYALVPVINSVNYGTDHGGCRTYGDIDYDSNYWQYPFFFDVCPYKDENGVSFPTGLNYSENRSNAAHVSEAQGIADSAGVLQKPEAIASERWVLPPPKTISLEPLPGQPE